MAKKEYIQKAIKMLQKNVTCGIIDLPCRVLFLELGFAHYCHGNQVWASGYENNSW
jgi:hypothetical protein